MKITRNWINQLTGLKLTDLEIENKLTMAGLEVEEMIPTVPNLEGVVVGYVESVEKVEGSRHLNKCLVDVAGKEKLQIICGAPNVAVGQKVPVATIGTELPGGFKIKKAKLMGVSSSGMICSEKELGLSEEASGIMVLDNNTKTGDAFSNILDEDDTIFDIAITPNRPDCFGAIGIARELCISAGKEFISPIASGYKTFPSKNDAQLSIEIACPDACPRYTGIVVKNIKVGPSPEWLQKRLMQIGLRPISNIVDITNYVLYETGQPMHAFDFDKIEAEKIIVRTAKDGEKFTTLDENEHELKTGDVLICDGKRAVALGGIMGGLNSEVSESTRNVLLEVAYFDPTTIRRTSKRLNLSTDASKRFERGMDPNGMLHASSRAVQLILDLAGGHVATELLDQYPKVIKPNHIKLRRTYLAKIIGKSFTVEQVSKMLTGLECKCTVDGEDLLVTTPTFRPDLEREIDLVEEIARLYGYNNIEDKLTNRVNVLSKPNQRSKFVDSLHNYMVALGLNECVTMSMVPAKSALSFVENDGQLVKMLNPLSEDMNVMRPNIASGLLHSIAFNINRKNSDLQLYELASVFKNKDGKVRESMYLGGLLTGKNVPASWANSQPDELDFFNAKGLVQTLLEKLRIKNVQFEEAQNSFFEYGLTILIDGNIAGILGKLTKPVLKNYHIKQDVFVFELDADKLFLAKKASMISQEISKFPAVERDIAIVVEKKIQAGEIEKTIQKVTGDLLTKLELFDIYEGEQIPEHLKSFAFALTFQSGKQTLQEQEIDALMQKVLSELKKKYSASLRDQ